MLAAGLGIAKAISSKRVDKRFASEVMDDENTDHNSNPLSSIIKIRKKEENNLSD